MKNIIDELIFKNSLFMEGIQYGETYKQILAERDKNYEKLIKTLNKEQIELLETLINSHIRLEAEASDCNLLVGFKTGLKLLIECL